MDEIAIKVENLSKIYKLYDKPVDRIKESLNPLRKKYHRDFYALKNLSFEVKKGETIGIIGKNGSGKSTLLKIITGVLTQTEGTVSVNGKVSALLELGAGFNPELTGLENVYLNGTIMGYSKEEMDAQIKEIMEFADIGEFIYQQVKTYSSGMFVRLAFAVAINVDPDILIVDEALAVGDIAFQSKCYRKFRDFQNLGKSIIFVTHSMDSILKFCNRAIVLDNGVKVSEGSPKEMVDVYKKILARCYASSTAGDGHDILKNNGDVVWKHSFERNPHTTEYGNMYAEIIDYGIFDENGMPAVIVNNYDTAEIRMKVKFYNTISEPIFAFSIKDVKGNELLGTNTLYEGVDTGVCKVGDIVAVTFKQKFMLNNSNYLLSLGCTGYHNDKLIVYHRLYDILSITITAFKNIPGIFDVGSVVDVKKLNSNEGLI